MSTLVIQECHLNLAEMQDAEKVRFLNTPIAQTGLFGDTVEVFVQQFSVVKKQSEAIKPLRLLVTKSSPLRRLHWLHSSLCRQPEFNGTLTGRWHCLPISRPPGTFVRLRSGQPREGETADMFTPGLGVSITPVRWTHLPRVPRDVQLPNMTTPASPSPQTTHLGYTGHGSIGATSTESGRVASSSQCRTSHFSLQSLTQPP